MLNNADGKLRQWFGEPFFLNNLFILALVYASTALPFTIYLLSGYFKSLAKDYEESGLCGRSRILENYDSGYHAYGKAKYCDSNSV